MLTKKEQIALEYWYNLVKDQVGEDRNTGFATGDTSGEAGKYCLPTEAALSTRLQQVAGDSPYAELIIHITALSILLYKYNLGYSLVSLPHVRTNDTNHSQNLLFVPAGKNGALRFREWVETVKSALQQGVRHRNYDYADLLRLIRENEVCDPAALFNVGIGDHRLIGEEDADYDRFGLFFYIAEQDNKTQVIISYDRDLYATWFIEQAGAHYLRVLSQLLHHPDGIVAEGEILQDTEIRLLQDVFNNTERPFSDQATIPGLFQQQARKTPDAIALVHGPVTMTYRDLNKKANQLAHYLQNRHGIRKEALVGIMTDRGAWMIISLLGVLKAGAAYVPIDPGYPPDRLAFLFADADLALLITDDGRPSAVQADKIISLHEDGAVIHAYPVEDPSPSCGPSNLAYVIYTSGSTGKPKGVMLEHAGVVNRIEWMWRHYGFSDQDVILQKTPFVFDVSVWELFMPLCFGARLVLCNKDIIYDPLRIIACIAEYHITTLHFVPGMLNLFLDAIRDVHSLQLKSLRHIMASGEALLPEVVKKHYRLLDMPLYNLYGPTEAAVDVTSYETKASDAVIPIGKPIWNIRIYILDQDMNRVPVGVTGELCIAGIGLARAYLNREELTAQRFVKYPLEPGGLYKTGDYARWMPDGNIEYIGRIDEQVKIRGYRIELGEIENVLLGHPAIESAAVLTRQEQKGERYLVAFFQHKASITDGQLKAYLEARLPDYMVPAFYIAIDQFPLTTSGKTDRKALARYEDIRSDKEQYKAPSNEWEERLVEIWQQELKIDRIGVASNYFSLGGDSLKAIRLVSRINNTLKTGLDVKDIFTTLTIERLAGFIAAAEDNPADTIADSLRRGLDKIAQFKRSIQEEDVDGIMLPPDPEDIYPFTSVEQGMIYASLLRSNEPVYYDQFTYEIEVADMTAFREAIGRLVMRHAILRTRYYLNRFSRPAKVVVKDIDIPFVEEDLAPLTVNARRLRIEQYLSGDLLRRLEFDGDILWHMRIFRLAPGKCLLVWSFHHAMLDGWSAGVFCAEMTKMLAGGVDQNALPVLQHSYKDYCAIGLERRITEEVQRFWQDTLAGYSRTRLPFNYSGKRKADTWGVRKVYTFIDPQLLKELECISREYQLSFKSICLSAHIYLLHLTCREDEIVTGVVTHDRPAIEDGDSIMGCFLNTIPVRVDLSEKKNALELIREVNDFLLRAQPNEIHLTDIANAIGEKASDNNLIFDCLLNFIDFHILEESGGIPLLPANDRDEQSLGITGTEMTNTLFDLEVSKTLGEFYAHIKYHPAYFSDQDMSRALELYVRILGRFVKDVRATIETTDLLAKEELAGLIYDFNDTVRPYSAQKTLHRLFEEQTLRTPGNTALQQDGAVMSYETLNRKANRLAHLLLEKGVRQGDNVGLLTDRGFDMIAGMYGILKTGAAYVPIDPVYPAERQQYIIDNSGITLLVADNLYDIEQTLSGKCHIVRVDNNLLTGYPDTNPALDIPATALAYVIYTSGSTGRPKGVMIQHHAAVNLVEWVNETFSIHETDRLLFITSMCFDLSVYDIFGMLAAGGAVVIAKQDEVKDVTKLIDILAREKITFWDSVPSTMNYLINEIEQMSSFAQQHLRLIFLSGDWIPVSLPGRIKKVFSGASVISLGGATEGTVWSNYYPIGEVDPNWPSIPYGKPIKNNFFYILDKDKKPVVKGAIGELYIGGVGVAEGYMNNPEKTLASFTNDPFIARLGGRMYKTGDLGRMLPDGNMEFLGRIDNQVKIRGFRVEPGEIESNLQKYPGVRESVVAVFKDENNSNYLCAYMVSDQEFSITAMKEFLGKCLPAYMIPAYFMRIPAIPVTANGKINRSALPSPQLLTGEKDTPEAGHNDLEIKVAGIVGKLLGLNKPGIGHDIFGLGANSLTIGALVNRIHREMEARLSPAEIFAHPTIAGLAAYIGEKTLSVYSDIPPAAAQEYYALSMSQRRLLTAARMDKDQNAYNISAAYLLEGELDPAVLDAALSTLIARHEILRTVFLEKDGDIKQQILPAAAVFFAIRQMDLSGSAGGQETVKDLLVADAQQPFDLAKAPLIRARLMRIGERQHVFGFTIHHIISDGWSMQIVLKELLQLYNAYVKGLPGALPPLRIQYKDYSEWERGQYNSQAFLKHQQYWLDRLKGDLPYLELPADHPRPAVKSFRGNQVSLLLPREVTQGISALAGKHRVSFFTALLTAVYTLLYRYTEQSDIIIGTAVSGRDHADLENNLGFYVNTLAMRAQILPEDSFASLLRKMQDITLEAFNHQIYPFDMLIERLQIPRDTGRLPLFEVMVVLQNAGIDAEGIGELDGLTAEEYAVENNTSKYDLLFNFTRVGDNLLVRLEYNSDIFEHSSIERLQAHFRRLWQAVMMNEYEAVGRLDYLSDGDRQQLEAFNDNVSPYPRTATIHELFEEQAALHSSKTAVVFKEKKLTYAALNERSNQLAHFLRKQFHIQPDDLAGIMLPQSEMNITAIIGVLKAGAGYIPIDPSYPQERIAAMLMEAGIKVLITDTGLHDELSRSYRGPVLCMDILTADITGQPVYNPEPITQAGNIAYVMHTSGTTGQPKGVIIEHRSVVRLVRNTNYITIPPGSRLLQTGALSFDATTFEIWSMLLNGGELHLLPKAELLNTQLLKQKLIQDDIGIIWLTSSWCNQLIDTDITLFGKLKYVLAGGEKLSVTHMNRLSRAYPSLTIINGYGPTENTTFSTCYRLERQYAGPIPIGKPLSNSKVYILDRQMQIVPVGVRGEICVGGDGLARGYLNRQDLTNERFVEMEAGRVYKTGDAGRWLPDGTIEFLGRRDDQVKIRGYRIELDEIRHTLMRHEEIDNALVTTKVLGGEAVIIAYVMPEKPLGDLKDFLRKYLPEYMIPFHIVPIPCIPLNTNGKTDFKALSARLEAQLVAPEQAPGPDGNGAPADETEEKLLRIWQQIFSRNTIGVEDDFFTLGGHSLKAVLMASYVSKELEVNIDLTDIFDNPRLKDLAMVIKAAAGTTYRDITKAPEQSYYELSHAQKRVWLSCQFAEEALTFHIINPVRFSGNLDVSALQRAFEEIIRRHESLRTTFVSVDGEPRQQIHPFDTFFSQIHAIDLTDPVCGKESIDKIIEEQGYMPFDLENGPLLRLILMKRTATDFVFLFMIHHIIADAWSMEVMVSEVAVLYNAFTLQKDPVLPALPIQYKDYACWQNDQLKQAAADRHRKFWKEHLGENIPRLELPADYPRPLHKTFDGSILHFSIDREVSNRLRETGHANHTSLFVTLLSSLYVLLYKHTGQKDVIIGLPSIGRKHKDLENQIGFYSNIIALRIAYAPDITFSDLLKQVRDNLLAAQEHDIYPFDRIIEDLALKKDPGRSFLFDVMAHMQGENIRGTETEELENISLSPWETDLVTSKYDLTFSFREDRRSGRIHGDIVYNTGLFNNSGVEKIVRSYMDLLQLISTNPLLTIWDIKKELLAASATQHPGQDILEEISSDY